MTASWVAVSKATGAAVAELYNPRLVEAVNRDKYDVIPILNYLQGLNKKALATD